MNRQFLSVLALSLLIALPSCISSEESGSNAQDPIVPDTTAGKTQVAKPAQKSDPKKSPSKSQQPRKGRLTSRQDTVVASVTRKSKTSTPVRSVQGPKNQWYTVQVGTFAKAQNALQFQKLAKERFPKNSVHNNYDARAKMYHVSIGRFTTKQEAVDLRRDILKKNPKDYAQAWVNYLR